MDFLDGENTIEKMLIKHGVKDKRPVSGTLELTPLCNMNCDMCYVHLSNEAMNKLGKMLSIEMWLDLAKQLERAGVLFITLTGGEPLLFPGFKELYLKLKRMGMVITINTNGTLIDEKWAAFFERNKPRRINITLYGNDEKTYRDLCHYPGGFEKTIRAIKLLKDHDIKVKMNGSVTKANFDQIDDMYQIARELDVPLHMDTYMLPGLKDRFKVFEKQSRLNPEDGAKARIKVLKNELGNEKFLSYVDSMLIRVEQQNNYGCGIDCQAGNSSFMINWQGLMKPCVSLFTPAVDVCKAGFDNAWKQIITKSKALKINGKCAQCKLRPLCNTCVATASWETGDFAEVPEYCCKEAKEMLRLLLLEKNCNH